MLKDVLWPRIMSVLVNFPWMLEEMCFFLLLGREFCMSFMFCCCWCLQFFYNFTDILSASSSLHWKWVWKSPSVIVDLSIPPCKCICFCFKYFEVLGLDCYTTISFCWIDPFSIILCHSSSLIILFWNLLDRYSNTHSWFFSLLLFPWHIFFHSYSSSLPVSSCWTECIMCIFTHFTFSFPIRNSNLSCVIICFPFWEFPLTFFSTTSASGRFS